jgi:hypothetical protein
MVRLFRKNGKQGSDEDVTSAATASTTTNSTAPRTKKSGLFGSGTRKRNGSANQGPGSANNSMDGGSDEDHRKSVTATTTGKPGAQRIVGNNSVFRVTVPENVEPGQEFQVYAGQRIVRVRCPPDTRPGQSLQITVPLDPLQQQQQQQQQNEQADNLPPDSPNVQRLENEPGYTGPPAYMVTIPDGVSGGQQFPITVAGQVLMVTCPPTASAGGNVRIVPPPPPPPAGGGSLSQPQSPPTDITERPTGPMGASRSNSTDSASGSQIGSTQQQQQRERKKRDEESQLFEVMVPPGVKPGSPFALLAGGVRVLVSCPLNAGPGQRIRFKLPLALTRAKEQPQSEAAVLRLKYDKDGWTRTIRASDMKFQWIRMDDKGDVTHNDRFHADQSAYVRKLQFLPGNDPRIRDGVLTFVPADEAVCDSRIKGPDDEDVITYTDIAKAQDTNFEEKTAWFHDVCARLCVEWNEGHMRINVRRQFLLEDSVDAVMSLNRKDLRKLWRFEFIGEMGIDAGGLAREWFELVTKEIFNPDMGLWQCSETNQMCMQINPASRKYRRTDFFFCPRSCSF